MQIVLNTSNNKLLRNWLPRIAILVWGITLIIVIAILMVDHWVTLPIPSGNDPKLAQAIDDSRELGELGQWIAVHVLYSKCTCSQRIVDHIFTEGRTVNIKEKLIIVDNAQPEWEELAKAKGFSYQVITAEELHDIYNIPAAPIMVVADPRGEVRYAGGYTARKQGPGIQDIEIIEQLKKENPVKPIPLFGCAVAKGLQKVFDPLGLKY